MVTEKIDEQTKIFNHSISVFKGWRQDTSTKLQMCYEHDISYIKWRQINLSHNIENGLKEIIQNNIKLIKYIYICLLGQSNQIGGIDLDTITIFLVNHCKFNYKLNTEKIAYYFELVNRIETTKLGKVDFPDTHRHISKSTELMCRKDLIELLIRICDIEYPKMTKLEAFQYFLQIITTKVDPIDEYENFRNQQLWTSKCNDVYNNNLDILEIIFKKYNEADMLNTDKLSDYISYNQVQKILMQDSIPTVCKSVNILR